MRTRLVLALVPWLRHAGCLCGVLCAAACTSGGGSPRCAPTRVSAEVCTTATDLGGAALVQETWTSAPPPVLEAQPLLDGRYVQTARTLYCAEDYDPPPVLHGVQSVAEIRGCVLRISTRFDGGDPVVAVQSFGYAGDGTLDLSVECPGERRTIRDAPYGFDGTTLHLPNGTAAAAPDGRAYDCQYVDTWTL